MKKLIYCAAALAAMIFAGSCQQENLEPVAQENTVTYTVELPDVQTKAIGDASTVDQLIYEVWKTETANVRDLTGKFDDGKAKATRLYQDQTALVQRNGKTCAVVTFNLVQDQEYTILFWAQKADTDVYNTDELTDVHYKYGCEPGSSKYFSNQENYAAFYAAAFVSDVDSKSRTVILKRPFAQLNIATKNTVKDYTVAMNTSKVTISNVATHFDVAMNLPIETAVSVPASFEFKTADVPTDPEQITVNGQVYDYVAMNYVFAMGPNVTVDYEINTTLTAKNLDGSDGTTTTAQIKHTVPNVPLKENYRTNIVGNLLSSTTEYYIEIDDSWYDEPGDGTEVEVWDGFYAQEPPQVNGVYQISLASELAWLAKAVNGTLVERGANVTKSTGYVPAQTFAGKKFVLTQDIDLSHDVDLEGNVIDYGPALWTPIGARADHPFKGTFDGNGCTIKNLYVDMDMIVENQRNIQEDLVIAPTDGAGLFGSCVDATIKDVTVEEATVKGHGKAAVIVADAIRTKVNDCHVENATVISTPYAKAYASNVGAIAGYLEGEDDFRSASVTGCSVVDATVTANNNVAGVVGASSKKTSILRNTVTNVQVVADKTTEYTADVAGNAGKVVSHDATGNCKAENNNVDENTTAVVKVDSGNVLGWQASNAPTDVVIEFGSNITGNDATIVQKVGVNVVVDGCDKKYDGTIYLEGGSQGNSPETLTLKNINFKHDYGTIDFISANDKNVGKRYVHNVTVEDCSFTGNSYGDVVAMRYRQTYNMSVKNVTGTHMHSLMWATGGDGIEIFNADVTNSLSGVSFGTTTNVSVNDSKFVTTGAFGYGVRVDASGAYKTQINNTKITAGAPVLMRNATGAYEMNISADSELTSTEVYQIIVASNDYEAGKTLVAPANNYVLNTNDVEYVVYPDAADLLMASSAETLKAAIAAANNEKFTEIKLANGTYTGAFDIDAKSVKISAINKHKATIDGLVHGLNFAHVTLKDLVLTNATPAASASARHNADYYCLGSYVTDWLIEDCIFNVSNQGQAAGKGAINIYANRDDYELYDGFDLTVKNTVFNCNGERPIRGKTNSWVEGCKFVDQHRYAIQVQGNSGLASETVKFVNNTIVDPCKTSGEAYVASVSISKSQLIEDAAFIIEGNTDAKFVYDNNDNVKITTCTLNGTLIAAGQCVSIPDVTDAKSVLLDYTEGATYAATAGDLTAALASDVKDIVLMPGTYEGTFHVLKEKVITSANAGNKAMIKGRVHVNSVNATFNNVSFDRNETNSNEPNNTASNALQYKAVVMIYGDQTHTIKFDGCNFYNNNGAHKSAITNVACDLIVDNCYFEGRSSSIYSQANLSVTNSTFNYTGGNNVILSINGCGANGGKVIFKNNNISGEKIFAMSQFLSTVDWIGGTYHFDVQGNTGAGFDYYFLNEGRVANKTFAQGSETF